MTAPTLTREEVIEDCTFLALNGVGIYEAAHRTGRTTEALEVLLRRANRLDLLHTLRAQETSPVDTWAGRVGHELAWSSTALGRHVLARAEEHRRAAADRHDDSPATTERRRLVLLTGGIS
ncbi:hypothetical protein [Cellulomonas composti]|uniref:Uncharacterized protein n=1 Tax=Cellulomonas composti TaxID=266130 RepID=A0A511JBL9_9CELL|nr:hypothetical protein [Cellulomonas composti]GEL95385.1 hypothetical protein CCO02nite_20430 [Cellulomonas composti]